jgi:hypothetical protein
VRPEHVRYSSVQADPSRRDSYGAISLNNGIDVTTICYRAPEVLFGNPAFGTAIDMWALGLVIFEVSGATFHFKKTGARQSQIDYMQMLFGQLGTPICEALTALPHFPKQPVKKAMVPWPEEVVKALGKEGVAFAANLLLWDPLLRPQAGVWLSRHPFLSPGILRLGGSIRTDTGAFEAVGDSAYSGERHMWNALEGQLSIEMLAYLQGDPVLDTSSKEHKALAVNFNLSEGQVKDAKSEAGRKFVKAGWAGPRGMASSACCALSLAKPLPIPRFQSWLAAFMFVNRGALEALRVAGKRRLYRLSEESRGQNGLGFMTMDAEQWFSNCGELCVSVPKMADGSYWEEPEHKDGGASVLHLGLTLFGRRHVRCSQGGDLPDIFIQCRPGSLYMGGFTGPVHQVCTSSLRPPTTTKQPTTKAPQTNTYDHTTKHTRPHTNTDTHTTAHIRPHESATQHRVLVNAISCVRSYVCMCVCVYLCVWLCGRVCLVVWSYFVCRRLFCFAGPARGGGPRGDVAFAWQEGGGEAGLGHAHDEDSFVPV